MIRARVDAVLAILCGALAIVTAVWPTWIESLTELDPDAGSGSAEWWLVLVLVLGCLGLAALARRDYCASRRRAAGRDGAPESP